MSDTKLILHIGSTKTGTKSIQRALAVAPHSDLRDWAYPQAGRKTIAHHNLAYEMGAAFHAAQRWKPEQGGWDAALAEAGGAARNLLQRVCDETGEGEVGNLLTLARNVLVVTWLFYPISYLAPVLGLTGGTGEVALQVGYTIADITAKAGFGVVIYKIAAARTAVEGETTGDMATA